MRGAPRPAAVVTLAYVLVTLPLFWRSDWTARHAALALAHAAAAGSLWWASRTRRTRSVLADWLPLLLVPLLYAELPVLIGNAPYHDAVVRAWEAALFGGQPARALVGAVPNVAVSEVLHLGYVLYYPIIYAPPLVLYLARQTEAYRRTVLAVMLTYVLCYLAFILFPVEGPRYAWGAPTGVSDGPIRWLTLAILERGSSRGTAFPSSHAAIAAVQSVLALRYQPRVGWIVPVCATLLMLGAVYGGFHYAVDVLAGAGLGIVVGLAVTAAR